MNSPQRQTERIFTTEAQRRGEKQSPNRRAQRWQRPQRKDPLGDQRLSAFGSRQSSRLRARSSQPTKNEEKQGFTTEAQRHGGKQSPNRRAQRWQRPQREDPLGDQLLSAFGSRQSSRLRARSSPPTKNEEKQGFTTEAQRHGGNLEKKGPDRLTARWKVSANSVPSATSVSSDFSCVPLCLCSELIRPGGEMVNS